MAASRKTSISRTAAAARKQARHSTLVDLRRSEILAAALKIFAKKGFHNTRSEDVAAQARIAKGTLYLYFDSKEAMYEAALTHAVLLLQTILTQRMLTVGTSVTERLKAFVTTRLEFWGTQHPDLFLMVLTVGRERRSRKHTHAIVSESVDSIVEILSEGIKKGELKKRPLEPIAWAVSDMLRGANERRAQGTAAVTLKRDADFITAAAMRYFE